MRTLSRTAVRPILAVSLLAHSGLSFAVESRLIEEVIVTAQRFEENASKVPISVSAFTDALINDRQIILISDLQLNVPNFSYSRQNFGSGRISIRGIGDLFLVAGGNRAKTVPFHINGISAPVDFSVIELYDLERVEVV